MVIFLSGQVCRLKGLNFTELFGKHSGYQIWIPQAEALLTKPSSLAARSHSWSVANEYSL